MTIAVIKRARGVVIKSGVNSAEVRRQAELAEAEADRSEAEADRAATEKLGSESARDAAIAYLNPHADQAAGEAATSEGEPFSYLDGNDKVALAKRTAGGSEVLPTYFGAEKVGYRTSSVAQRLSGEWSVLENLTSGQADDVLAFVNGDDLAPKINEMLVDSTIKSLTFPPGFYRVEKPTSGDCLLLERNINLIAPGGQQRTRIVGYMSGNTTGAVLRVQLAGSGDVRNWTMRGLGIYPEPSVGGKDGLYISSSGLPMLTCEITDCFFGRNPSNAGRAAFLGYVFAHSELRHSTVSGGIVAECGDRNIFFDNTIFGSAAEFAYIFDLVDGVRNNTVILNTLVNTGGAVHVKNGQEVNIIDNQCEQAGGVNANPVGAMIWLQGIDRPVENTNIYLNNFGGGTNYKCSLYIDNARGTKIKNGNRFTAPGQDSVGGNADVIITSNARDTLIGPDNYVKGTTFSPRLDRTTPVATIDTGVGTVGSSRMLIMSSGWSCGGFWKDENGQVHFRSEFIGGSVVAGTLIGTLPRGYRPAQKIDAVRRNLLSSTADFSTASWVKTGVTVTKEAGTSPTDRNEYQEIAATATTGSHQFRDAGITFGDTSQRAISFYVQRKDVGSVSQIRGLIDGPTGSATFTVNLDTGAVIPTASGGAAVSGSSVASGSGWRVTLLYTPAATGTHYLRFTPSNQSSIYNSYTGNPAVDTFLLWGPQTEVGGAATAYQAVYSATRFSTQIFERTIPVQTSGGAGTVTVSSTGAIKVASLPAANFEMPPIQCDIRESI